MQKTNLNNLSKHYSLKYTDSINTFTELINVLVGFYGFYHATLPRDCNEGKCSVADNIYWKSSNVGFLYQTTLISDVRVSTYLTQNWKNIKAFDSIFLFFFLCNICP